MTRFRHVLAGMFIALTIMSCQEEPVLSPQPEEDGLISLSIRIMEREVYKLTNAGSKQHVVKNDYITFYNIYNANEQPVKENIDMAVQGEISLKPGNYRILAYTVASNAHSKPISVGSRNFNVKKGQRSDIEIMMMNLTAVIRVKLSNMPNATVWLGPNMFTPSDEYLYEKTNGTLDLAADDMEFDNRIISEGFYPEDLVYNWDIVVEFDGVRKIYPVEIKFNQFIDVTIVRNDQEEPIDQGSVAPVVEGAIDEERIEMNIIW